MNILPEVKKKIVVDQEAKTSASKILQLIQTYDNLSLEDFPRMEAAKKAYIQEELNKKPNPQEQKEWSDIAALLETYTSSIDFAEKLRVQLATYIQKWERLRPCENHVDEANARYSVVERFISQYWQNIEENDWANLDYDSNRAIEDYLERYPHTCHKDELDDCYWVNISKEDINQIEGYLSHPLFRKNRKEAEKVKTALVDWMKTKNLNDIFAVSSYIKNNADSPFHTEAANLLMSLKQSEVNKMKMSPSEYEVATLMRFLNEGIFTEYELKSQDVLTSNVLETLRDPYVLDTLPDIQYALDNSVPECKDGYTDVYFFGIPSTGKTCILMGLSRSNSLHINLAHGGGEYAAALQQYIDTGLTVPATRMGTAATLEAVINDKASNAQHKINLIEMAGEEFARKIAGNKDHIYDFDSMGTGVTELLKNDNKKVFFLIIDPTTSVISYNRKEIVNYDEETGDPIYELVKIRCNQQNLITKMVDLFAYPGNADIMKKVNAIHVIVTKADLLGADTMKRDDKALEIFNSKYGYDVLDPLYDLCKKYNINLRDNYRPRLYTFSLGKFYVGGLYEYDSSDSNKLVAAIRNSTDKIKKKSFWDKVKEKLN